MNARTKFVVAFVGTFVLFFLILPSTITVFYYVLERIFSLAYIPAPFHLILFAIVFVIGWIWMIWSNYYIFRIGKGTSLEVAGQVVNPTQRLVTTGPYAYCRNPMAFGFVTAFVMGIGFLFHSLWPLIVTPLAFLALGAYERRWEEKGLERRFGEGYRRYHAATPMFIPRLWRPYAEQDLNGV
jgi:protein-S-isoprenylcysteine O-methyltransferase Ste14